MYDIMIVGAGFSGAVTARQLAEKHGKKVLVLEKRGHIGGNMYEAFLENGVRVHQYGPHIFHTNSSEVFEYLKRFSDFYPYEHRVLGKIDGKLVPIPFNFTSLETLFPAQQANSIKCKLKAAYPEQQKISILELLKAEDAEIRDFGNYVFDRVFVHYTAKQWQQPIEEVDTSVINRVPVVLGYDDRYFQDKYQFMPKDGYTALFERLLGHPGIHVELNCDAAGCLRLDANRGKIYFEGELWDKPIVFTGAPDSLLNYCFGSLPYRSLNLVFEQLPVEQYQAAAVVNYPNEEEFTRITEFKFLTNQSIPKTTAILKEYPTAYQLNSPVGGIPYYPIINDKNRELYLQYVQALKSFKNLYLCGRLADYLYYNMDAAVARALKVAEEIAAALS